MKKQELKDITRAKEFLQYCHDKITELEIAFIPLSGNVKKELKEIESWEQTEKRARHIYTLLLRDYTKLKK
jgi:hypothetical protein